MATQGYLEKFESSGGGLSYTFPLGLYEWESAQSLRAVPARVNGAGYALDLLADSPSPQELARETVRALINASTVALAEAERGDMRAKCWRIGRGKLYVLMSDGTRRWAWARLSSMPSFTLSYQRAVGTIIPYIVEFDRYSTWFATSATTGSETVTATGEEWTVNNPGNTIARLMVIRERSNSAAGFTNPKLTNVTNGYILESTRDAASSSDELKWDTEVPSLMRSTNDGGSYADDSPLIVIGNHPPMSFRLEPGDNTLRYNGGGTPNLNVDWSFYAPYEY